MNYHNITRDDMNNGDGLRVVLWVAGCNHHCKNCQNPITWNIMDGIKFDNKAFHEICIELNKNYISGLTLSGGDPLHPVNRHVTLWIVKQVKKFFPTKTIWIYTGYTWESIIHWMYGQKILSYIDVLVDGRYEENLKDVNYHWAGSTNQRVINVPQSLEEGRVVLHESDQERRHD